MITPWTVYWITRLDDIRKFPGDGYCALAAMVGAAAMVAYVLCSVFTHDPSNDKSEIAAFATGKKLSLIVGTFCITILTASVIFETFVPTKKDMAAIILIPPLANGTVKLLDTPEAKQLPKEILALTTELTGAARDWLQELRPPKEPLENKK